MQAQSHAASSARTSEAQPKSGVPRMWVVLAVAVVLVASVATGVVGKSFTGVPNRAATVNRGITHPGLIEEPRAERPTRVERAASWLKGLATGMIIQSDVTGRLQQQDPELAQAVMAAWDDLQR
jgi:hypothetical protein